jgi:S1-C subfamily serine protease
MRSQVAVPFVCAVLGGGIAAAALLAAGVVAPGARTTIVQSMPLLSSGPVGGSAAGDIYRAQAPGVVAVTSRSLGVPSTAFDLGSARSDGSLSGSGFVVGDNGRIVTAAHLVRAASDVRVWVGGHQLPARVLGLDQVDDIALLSVDPGRLALQPLELADSDAVRVGDPAYVLGRSFGLKPTLTTATVAARQPRVIASGGATVMDALQVDAPLHPGDCGGPLLDGSGRVTGVNTRMVTGDGETVDIAVPANTVSRMLPQLTGTAMKVVGG